MSVGPTTVGALRDAAARATSTGVERGVGALLGADPAAAAAAVQLLADAGRLGEGLALPALLIAARRGTDAAGAVEEIASGRPLPESWSDYERRTAAEEVADDVRAVLHRRPDADGAHLRCGGADAAATAASAVRTGGAAALVVDEVALHADGLSLLRAIVDAGWVRRLGAVARVPVVPPARSGDAADDARLAAALADVASPIDPGWSRGTDEAVPTSAARLDLLG